ncbi:outer envelope pore protein 16-4, chloroplastic isoform X2 [Amborella trichopoda]|uniref:outer envelope pore protein 16-4, chloroplastic isoform X2 n=1 Tax=Amborella trichopoda TaxID=13333 RepID=UPI0009BD0E3F|nr:outer envelope pore protein 16-4, chloroplastic isoform X2 [Amborella trichopoda]XP_020529731.1 outer envelope pore protein 16-4, chloroplastic isoform X2 [Amborella trichopoda]|eukprot:XP_020529730.1 outer envelope pore protein 16-4, chloroplastic isoform X2 [Amborella trichopoda]
MLCCRRQCFCSSWNGLAWGVVSGPYRADKRGLAGVARTTFLMKRVGTYSLLWGSLGGAFHAIRCGVRRYRMQEDWVNSGIAGAIAGAALGMKTRSLTQIAITSVIVSGIVTVIDSSKPF